MYEEHTRGTRINLLQIIVFFFPYIFHYVCNVFKLQVFTSQKTRNMDEEHTRGSRIHFVTDNRVALELVMPRVYGGEFWTVPLCRLD